MNCAEIRNDLSAFLDEELSPSERATVEAHLAGCAACRGELDALRRTVLAVRGLGRVRAPADFLRSVRLSIREDVTAPSAPAPSESPALGAARAARREAFAASAEAASPRPEARPGPIPFWAYLGRALSAAAAVLLAVWIGFQYLVGMPGAGPATMARAPMDSAAAPREGDAFEHGTQTDEMMADRGGRLEDAEHRRAQQDQRLAEAPADGSLRQDQSVETIERFAAEVPSSGYYNLERNREAENAQENQALLAMGESLPPAAPQVLSGLPRDAATPPPPPVELPPVGEATLGIDGYGTTAPGAGGASSRPAVTGEEPAPSGRESGERGARGAEDPAQAPVEQYRTAVPAEAGAIAALEAATRDSSRIEGGAFVLTFACDEVDVSTIRVVDGLVLAGADRPVVWSDGGTFAWAESISGATAGPIVVADIPVDRLPAALDSLASSNLTLAGTVWTDRPPDAACQQAERTYVATCLASTYGSSPDGLDRGRWSFSGTLDLDRAGAGDEDLYAGGTALLPRNALPGMPGGGEPPPAEPSAPEPESSQGSTTPESAQGRSPGGQGEFGHTEQQAGAPAPPPAVPPPAAPASPGEPRPSGSNAGTPPPPAPTQPTLPPPPPEPAALPPAEGRDEGSSVELLARVIDALRRLREPDAAEERERAGAGTQTAHTTDRALESNELLDDYRVALDRMADGGIAIEPGPGWIRIYVRLERAADALPQASPGAPAPAQRGR